MSFPLFQAYQCLFRWYTHNGRRASVDRLKETLRELNENRLADSIEIDVTGEEVTDLSTAESGLSRPSSQTCSTAS